LNEVSTVYPVMLFRLVLKPSSLTVTDVSPAGTV